LLRQHAQHVDMLSQQLNHRLNTALSNARVRLNSSTPRITRAADIVLRTALIRLNGIGPAMAGAAKSSCASSKHRLSSLTTRLESVNPTAVLARGYAIVKTADGSIAKRIADIKPGETITTQLVDGTFRSITIEGNAPPTRHRKGRAPTPPAPEQLTLL